MSWWGLRWRVNERCIQYIVRRTQLYLDDAIWNVLHARARTDRTTISELVREAVRERYLGKHDERLKAMLEFVGIAKDSEEPGDSPEIVRKPRRGSRVQRVFAE